MSWLVVRVCDWCDVFVQIARKLQNAWNWNLACKCRLVWGWCQYLFHLNKLIWGILSIIDTCNHVLCCVSQGYVICKTSTTVEQLLHIWLWYLWQTKLSPFFCFVTNSVRYLHTKNYPNKTWFDNLIAKMELCDFFPGGVITSIICYAAFCVPCTDDMWLRETLPGKSDQHPGIKWLLWLHW